MGSPYNWSREQAFRRDEDNCLLWRGCYDSAGRPVFYAKKGEQEPRAIQIHRAIMALIVGRPLQRRELVMPSCGKPGCCSCLEIVTEREKTLRALARYNWNRNPLRRARIAAKVKKLYTIEQVEQMRQMERDGDSRATIRARFGCTAHTPTNRILNYQTYITHLPPALQYALAHQPRGACHGNP